MYQELTDGRLALIEALLTRTVDGTLSWETVCTFPMTFVARVRNNTFVLFREVDDYPDLLALNSSYAVLIKSVRNLALWSRVADSYPPHTLQEDRQLAAIRGMTMMVNASEGAT